MNKIVLSTVLVSSLMMAAEVAQDQVKLASNIAEAKAQKSAAEAKLKALEAQLPQNQEIITNVKFGYIQTDGNANTETFALEGSFKKEWDKNSAKIIFDSQYGQAENVENKNKYFTELQYAYAFSKDISFTYMIGYKSDKFSSYNYQAYTGPGAKYHAYDSEKQKLDFEGSLLYAQDDLQAQNVVAPNDATTTYTSYLAKLAYEIKILDNLKFNQDLSYRSSFEDSNNFFVFSTSALSSKLSDIFSAGISYKVDYTNEVAAGIFRRDNTLSAFLSLDY
ncbi:DUF481 domain-containing protein [Sulfurimonas sp. SAG-AH-194-L11]|nr:DUF481 domain-containing protein [Sulfurimonas sp. SAG-AH-194-L11]MDF1876273.1 DUF481 domain-containing protein [Sulfurimonas sp. SAG-AH-194-L11]